MNRKLSATLLAAMLVLTAFAPAAVSAQESTESTTDLALSLVQDAETGDATLTVTNGSSPEPGATVNVTSGGAYAGDGQYTTDENGTVELPNPTGTLDVSIEATSNGAETTETFTLVPVENSISVAIAQNDDGTAVVTVTQYGEALSGAEVVVTSDVAYAGNDTYTTDADGTVDLPEPAETTDVDATVTSGELEAFGEATIEPIAEFEVDLAANADGTATITVTRDAEPVEGANVTISSDVPYAGNGTTTTDANGTVALPEPQEPTNVTVVADDADDEATTEAQLSPVDTGLAVDVVQNDDGTATVTVTDDGSAVDNATVNVTSDVPYDGNGTSNTSADGTVELPNPDENVTVTVLAINGSEEATTTAELEAVENGGFKNFGQWITSFIQQLKTEGYHGAEFGQEVSEFATENNPGADKKPDHAGPKDRDEDETDGDAEASDADDKRGPPEHAKNKGKDKNKGEKADETEEDDDAETSDSDETDCSVEDSDESCEGDDETEDDEDDEDDDDSPGNSGKSNGKSKGRGN